MIKKRMAHLEDIFFVGTFCQASMALDLLDNAIMIRIPPISP